MPILGLILGKVDFASLEYLSIHYGLFIQAIVDFLLIAFSLFIFIKVLTSFKKKKFEEVIVIKYIK